MTYHIELSAREERLIREMAYKGYDCGLAEMMDNEHTCIVSIPDWELTDDSPVRYSITEHAVWAVYELYTEALEAGNDPLGPFVAETIRSKFEKLMEEVV